MDTNRFKFNMFLLKNLILLYVLSIIIISIIESSPLVLIYCMYYTFFSLPIFLYNVYSIRQNNFISYFVFSGLNIIYLIVYLNKIFTKETVTSWENVKGILVEYTRTYYFYEINSGSVHFQLTCLGIFLFLQLVFWRVIVKKKDKFDIDLF
jgi:hypothetical protein